MVGGSVHFGWELLEPPTIPSTKPTHRSAMSGRLVTGWAHKSSWATGCGWPGSALSPATGWVDFLSTSHSGPHHLGNQCLDRRSLVHNNSVQYHISLSHSIAGRPHQQGLGEECTPQKQLTKPTVNWITHVSLSLSHQ